MAQVNSCDRDRMVSQAADTQFPALYRKSLLPPGLSCQRRTRLNEWTRAFSPVSSLKERRSILSASEGTVCLPGLSPVTVISCPGRDLLRCDIHRPKTPFPPTSLKLRHFWGTVLFSQGYRNCQKCRGGLLRIGRGNVIAPAPGHKATSPLSFPPAQVTPSSYTEFITSPSPSLTYCATPGTVSIRTCMVEKMLLAQVYVSPLASQAAWVKNLVKNLPPKECRRCKRHGLHPYVGTIPVLGQSPCWDNHLEKGMATHSTILA